MAKRASLTKSAIATKTTPKTGESLSIEKQEEIIQKASNSKESSKKGSARPVQRLTIDIPTELYQKMKDLKYDQGVTSKGLIVSLLRKHFA